jgi:catechol 2,3-dioxygenase-like lactoylglutathione lyase family enzyme
MLKIHGIQHIGVAVSDMNRTLPLYRKWFGMNIPFFDSVQAAPLMQVFTRNEVLTKRASMVMNLRGGSAMEIIEPTSFKPAALPSDFQLGDIGIFAIHMRMSEPSQTIQKFDPSGLRSDLHSDPMSKKRFLVQDPDGNYFVAVEDEQVYFNTKQAIGGIGGISIGVADIEASKAFYAGLGFDQVLYEGSGVFSDFQGFPGGDQPVQRLILGTKEMAEGPFGAVIGFSKIELIATTQRKGLKIFRGRIWGDTGFVHLGLDVHDMRNLQKQLSRNHIEFKCDSQAALDMGKTSVHCAYITDPDGILIELIEVYKIPLIEKWGVFLNVHGRRAGKHLPKWLLQLLRFSALKN